MKESLASSTMRRTSNTLLLVILLQRTSFPLLTTTASPLLSTTMATGSGESSTTTFHLLYQPSLDVTLTPTAAWLFSEPVILCLSLWSSILKMVQSTSSFLSKKLEPLLLTSPSSTLSELSTTTFPATTRGPITMLASS